MNEDNAVRDFKRFIDTAWDSIERATSGVSDKEELIDDWLQANWEILVEAPLFFGRKNYLEVYGDGAECNGSSSRVCFPDVVPTHRVECQARNGEAIKDYLTGRKIGLRGLEFNSFVSWNGRTYDRSPPFDFVLLEGSQAIHVVNQVDVVFAVRKIGE